MGKTKILLMVPVISFVKVPPKFPDLGLGYLATAVKNNGYDVSIRSWNMDPSPESFKRYLEDNKFDVVAMKVFTKDVLAANKTTKIIRSITPSAVIIVGGPHPSTSDPDDIMEDFPDCNFAFRGEAEKGLPLLLSYLSSQKKESSSLEEVPGLVWRDGGSTHSNSPLFVKDLDSFGMVLWDLMNPRDYNIKGPDGTLAAPVTLTRGCASNCAYCAAFKLSGKPLRTRSVESVIQELELLKTKYNVGHIIFTDTRFTGNIEVVKELCNVILRNKLDITWNCIGYEDMSSLTEDALKLMKKAGCIFINVGIEAGSDKMRERIKKVGTTGDLFRKICLIKEVGIGVTAFFMIGYPGETRKDIKDSVRFAFSLPADTVQFEIAYPHPGTELLKYLKSKYNVKKIDWESFDVYRSPYPLAELASSELYRYLMKIKFRYKLGALKKKLFTFWK